MKKYDKSQIRVMSSGYKLSLAIISVLAVALMVFMFLILPAVQEEPDSARRITSIEYQHTNVGLGIDLDQVNVEIKYSDNHSASVALSDTYYYGVDVEQEGQQSLSINYGGFEQVIPINVVDVSFKLNYQISTGGTIEGELTQNVPAGGNGNKVIARPEVGYIFKDWSDGNPEPERKDINVRDNKILTANFEKAKFIVIFRYPDGTVAREQQVTYNEKPTQIPVPTDREMQVYGYVFDRWSLPFEHVTQDMTIDPIFVKRASDVTVDITKNNKGDRLGTVDVPIEGYYPKDVQARMIAKPMQARSFDSWQIKRFDGEWITISVQDIRNYNNFKVVDIGQQGNSITFEAGQIGDSFEYYLMFTPTSNTNLIEIKANFVYDESTITFINSMNSNVGNIEKTINLPNGQPIGSEVAEPQGSGLGYSFIGWFREDKSVVDEFGKDLPVSPEDTFTQPVALIARWQKVYFSVDYLKGQDDGDFASITVYVLYQNTIAAAVEEPVFTNPVSAPGIPTKTPQLQSHIFIGWYLVGDGDMLTDVVIDEDYKVFENIKAKPKFIPVTHNLQLNIIGGGKAQMKKGIYQSDFVNIETGINKVEEISQYIYKFIANEGYQIKSIDVNGILTEYGANVFSANQEVYFPKKDLYITAEFIPKTHVITINNGLNNDYGTITYTEKVQDNMVEMSKSDAVVSFSMEYNTSRNIYVLARDTHFIDRITIGTWQVDSIPAQSSEYTIILNPMIVTGDTTITIEYRPFAYIVDLQTSDYVNFSEVDYNQETDLYSNKPKSASYAFSQSPLFSFDAIDGYYITGLIINGKTVDLYSPDLGFTIFNISINNEPQQSNNQSAEIKDPRVTSFIFQVENIDKDYNIESIYAPLYYNINITRQGRGRISDEFIKTSYNQSIQAHAETDGGYYVKSYIINGQTTTFNDMLELQTIDINNITEDKDIVIVFSIATYNITFDGSSGGGRFSSVRKDTQEYRNLNASYAAEHNSSNKFTIKANSGYYISRILIANEEIVIPNKVIEYDLQIDNITSECHIIVNCAKITYTVTTTVNNSLYGSATEQLTLNHGEDAIINITYNPGYSLESISEGVLSQDNSTLTISRVVANKTININFQPIIYNISVTNYNSKGEVDAPVTAIYNEQIFVLISASDGYKISSLAINGQEQTLTYDYSSYAFSYVITDTTNIEVAYESFVGIDAQQININQSGGTVNGLSGNYAATIYANSVGGAVIKAPAYHYISSISGQTITGSPDKYALLLDGSLQEINVEYASEQYDITINSPANGTVQILVSQLPDSNFENALSAGNGEYIRIEVNPDQGYMLDYIKINGIIATNYLGENTNYTYTDITCAQNIEVSYKLIELNVITEVSGGYGTISADNSFDYGDSVIIKIIPATGYKTADISINGQSVTPTEKDYIIANNFFEIEAGSDYSKDDIYVRVSFDRIYLRVNISLDGDGRIDQAFYNEIGYGDHYYIDITAGENNFIDAVEVQGIRIEVDNTNLSSYTFNDVTQKYTAGRYRLHVTKHLNVRIFFKLNVYSVTVLPSINGTTITNLIPRDLGDSALDITSIEHGNYVQISMEANKGYNISKLFINSQEVTNFKHDNVNPNNNRLINYLYKGVNEQGVNNNILIRVDYEINYYKLQFQTINESPNFRDFDLVSSSYGSFSLLGNYVLQDNVYSGIPHGENFRLSINPIREKGYLISGVTITYMDPDSLEQSLITIQPQVGGQGSTILRTGTIIFFSELMGQYASSMLNDVQNVQIRFTKETFVYDQEVVSSPETGTISTRIYHPNDATRAMTVGSVEPSSLVLVNGRYEFGLGYTISIIPSVGHTRTAFYFLSGSAMLDRNDSVRANTYNSILQSDLHAKVEYQVNKHDITYKFEVYSFNGTTRINNPGFNYGTIEMQVGEQTFSPTTQGVISYSDCAYGTPINFIMTPGYELAGYYIHSFIVGVQNLTNNITDKNSPYQYTRAMTDSDLVVTVVFKINTYSISYIHEGSDGRSSVVSETHGNIPWGYGAVLRLNTDAGYNLLSLEVYQNGVWTERKGDIIYNHMQNLEYRDILQLSSIKENIIVKAVYERKEYDITLVINDLDKASIRVDVIGDFYENRQDIPQTYSQKTEETEGWVYDHILGDYYWGTIEYNWDIITMQAKHYDELLFYLMPIEGYRIKELIENGSSQFDKIKMSLYKYVDDVRVPVTDNFGDSVVYYINSMMWEGQDSDYRRFFLPTGIKLTSDIEVEIDFVLKEYNLNIQKNDELNGVSNCAITIEKLQNGEYAEYTESKLSHFENIKISIRTINGLSLDDERFFINEKHVPFSSYELENDAYGNRIYVYEYILDIDDELLNNKNFLDIRILFTRNQYEVGVEIYDTKSEQTTYGNQAPTLKIEVISIITHGNILYIRPVLSEGYIITAVIINGQDYSAQIMNMNVEFSFNVAGALVNGLDVHDPSNDSIELYFITAIKLHTSSIRAFVYELGVDDFSDIAGDTTITYNPTDTMVMVDGRVKYEYFTQVKVSAIARSTYEKTYRFDSFQEKINGVWQIARDGERGIELSGANNSIMEYTINIDDNASVTSADREFRVIYYRVLTVDVTVMPPYKYVSGYHTNNNMTYLPYMTVEAMVGAIAMVDQNPENTLIYSRAAQDGSVPYVEKYTYYIDSGSYLVLRATDHDNRNISLPGFYDRIDSTTYQIIDTATTSGVRIMQDRDIHLVCRNETKISFDISTIKNESNTYGGNLTWSITNKDNAVQQATIYRGSMTSAKVLDTVKITVKATENYRFIGMYVKNVDYQASKESGQLMYIQPGQIGEWTLMDTSTDLIKISQDYQGNTVYTIFITSNMVLKFEFYRTFKVSYGIDYQEKGDGPGDLTKDNNSSSIPIHTQMFGDEIEYDIYDYNSQIRLIAAPTNDDYQFVGWSVNGENIYLDLDIRFPDEGYFAYWFRLYQNNVDQGITDGLNLRNASSDVYEIEIIALYQPIFKLSIINEAFFSDPIESHWNTWRPTSDVRLNMYEYFSYAQVNSNQTQGSPYALATSQATKSIIMSNQPSNFMLMKDMRIPNYAFSSEYDGQLMPWSQLEKAMQEDLGGDWYNRKVYTDVRYYKMLYKALENIDTEYNNWTDNILHLETFLMPGMTLQEWQYYDFATGEFVEIPYVSDPITSGGQIIGHNNSAKKTYYTINLSDSQCDFIDHTKPLVIRPKYQKKVTLTLGKKAYYDFLGDYTTTYNSQQTPQIFNSPETDTQATVDYYSKWYIVPRAAAGFRFIEWYTSATGDEIDYSLALRPLPGEESTLAWLVHLKFEYGEPEQNNRFIHGRYIKQWEIKVESKNLATGTWAKHDAPMLSYERIVDLRSGQTVTNTERYIRHTVYGEDANWTIQVTLDAGLALDVDVLENVYTQGALQGYNPEFDVLYDYTPLRLDKGDQPTFTTGGDFTHIRVSAYSNRTVAMRYESFGEIIFQNLMWYAGIRLTDVMSNYIKDRFPNENFGSGPIVVKDADDGAIDGKASFNRIPIRNVNYLGSGLSLTYDYVPYGFNLAEDRYIPIKRTILNDPNLELAHFDSRRSDLIKRVTINYQNYKMFGIQYQALLPGTLNNPYLIGVNPDNSSQQSSILVARQQFKNIEVFFDNNGYSCKDISFALKQDIHLNAPADPNATTYDTSVNAIRTNTYNWIPICYKNDSGFDGILLGNGFTFRSLYVNGMGNFAVFDPFATDADLPNKTSYDYLSYGYGIFSSIHNGIIVDVNLGTASITLDYLKNLSQQSSPGLSKNVGILAARVSGQNTVFQNINTVITATPGYTPDFNIYIKAIAAANVGIIAGSMIGETSLNAQNNTVINSSLKNIQIGYDQNIYITGKEYLGGVVGLLEKTNVDQVSLVGGIMTIEASGTSYIGGIIGTMIGQAKDALITNSYVNSIYQIGSGKSDIVGGLVAILQSSEITTNMINCHIWGGSYSFVKANRAGNVGDTPDTAVNSGIVGGLVGYNNRAVIDYCTIRNRIMLYGFYAGGIVGKNIGIVRNSLLRESDFAFNVEIETPSASNGAYGIIVGINQNASGLNGLVTDCAVFSSSATQTYDITNTKLVVYPQMTPGKALNFTPGENEREAVMETMENRSGYTSIGGIVGLNQGRVFNSYIRNAKILAMKNERPPFNFHLGGVVGYNQVGSITQGRGISSCYSDNNVMLVSSILWAQDATASYGIGGVAGGTASVSNNEVSDFSIRYCYAINNYYNLYSACYGTNFINGDDSHPYNPFDDTPYRNPGDNETKMEVNVGLIVGGAKNNMSRAYYSWGATNSSWSGLVATYGDTSVNGGSFRNGPVSRLLCFENPSLSSAYSGHWNDTTSENYFARLIKLNVEITETAFDFAEPSYLGDNRPITYGGFIARDTLERIYDSRVIKTNEQGNLMYTLKRRDFNDQGMYTGSAEEWQRIIAALVPNQAFYFYTY